MIAVLSAVLVMMTAGAIRHARRRASTAPALRRLPPRSGPNRAAATGTAFTSSPALLRSALVRAGFGEHDPDQMWARWIAIAAVAAVLTATVAGPAVTAMVLVIAAAGPPVALWALRDRGGRQIEASLPFALESVAGFLRAGSSMPQALAATGEVTPGVLGTEIGALVIAAGQGSPLDVELERWERRRPLPGVHLVVAALALGFHTGGPQARSLDAVAFTLRDREAVRREAVALSSQARASAAVMVVMPVAFAGVAAAVDPRVAQVILTTPLGLACLAGGLLLDTVAALWMARITGAEW